MSYQAEHSKLGKIEVLIEAEIDHASSLWAKENTVPGKKYFALIKCKNTPVNKNYWERPQFKWSYNKKTSKIVPHHYVLWGNTPDLADMGITQLLTPSERPVKGSSPINWFFKFIKSSEFMTFTKK